MVLPAGWIDAWVYGSRLQRMHCRKDCVAVLRCLSDSLQLPSMHGPFPARPLTLRCHGAGQHGAGSSVDRIVPYRPAEHAFDTHPGRTNNVMPHTYRHTPTAFSLVPGSHAGQSPWTEPLLPSALKVVGVSALGLGACPAGPGNNGTAPPPNARQPVLKAMLFAATHGLCARTPVCCSVKGCMRSSASAGADAK